MNKFIKLLLFAFVITLSFIMSCNKSVGHENLENTQFAFSEVIFNNYTVDVSNEADFAVKVYNYHVDNVYIDDEKISKDNYIVKNGYFTLAYENYALIGLGSHNVRVEFAAGTKQFSLNVLDEELAKFTLTTEMPSEYSIGEYTLPLIKRLSKFQEYDVAYSLTYNGNPVTLPESNNGYKLKMDAKGSYEYTVTITKNEQSIPYKYIFNVVDKYEFEDGYNYVNAGMDWCFNGSYENNYIITSGTSLNIDTGLIERAKYSGYNYMYVEIESPYENSEYVGLKLNPTKLAFNYSNSDDYWYSHSGVQTVLIDISKVTTQTKTYGFFYATKPLKVYTLKFVKEPIIEDINFASQSYEREKYWYTTYSVNGVAGNMCWDYQGDDVMKLHSTRTIGLSQCLIRTALSLGYTNLTLDVFNAAGGYVYYNANLSNFDGDYSNATAENSKELVNNRSSISINLTNANNFEKEYCLLCGVVSGDLIIEKAYFTKKELKEFGITYNSEQINKFELYGDETLDLTKFGTTIDSTTMAWTLNGNPITLEENNLSLDIGAYILKAKIVSGSYVGEKSIKIYVLERLTFESISSELVDSAISQKLWKEEVIDNKITTTNTYLYINNHYVTLANENGYNYLNLTFGVDSMNYVVWASNYNNLSCLSRSASTWTSYYFFGYDASFPDNSVNDVITITIELSGITNKDGYTAILMGYDTTKIVLYSASFENRSVSWNDTNPINGSLVNKNLAKNIWNATYDNENNCIVSSNNTLYLSNKAIQIAKNNNYQYLKVTFGTSVVNYLVWYDICTNEQVVGSGGKYSSYYFFGWDEGYPNNSVNDKKTVLFDLSKITLDTGMLALINHYSNDGKIIVYSAEFVCKDCSWDGVNAVNSELVTNNLTEKIWTGNYDTTNNYIVSDNGKIAISNKAIALAKEHGMNYIKLRIGCTDVSYIVWHETLTDTQVLNSTSGIGWDKYYYFGEDPAFPDNKQDDIIEIYIDITNMTLSSGQTEILYAYTGNVRLYNAEFVQEK